MTRASLACLAVLAGCFSKPPFDGGGSRDGGNSGDAVVADAGPGANVVFVTSTTTSVATMGGLTGADALCTARAMAGGLVGTFKAWLSSNAETAVGRIGATGARGWVRPDGKPFGDTLADITNGVIYYPPRIDELGNDLRSVEVLTGTTATGIAATSTCSGLSPSGTSIANGLSDATRNKWTFANSTIGCGALAHLYCFQTDHNTPVTLAPSMNPLAFVSSEWHPGGGVVGADQHCQDVADVNSLPGTFRALLATTTTSAASRFISATTPWVRRDGVQLSTSTQAMFDGAIDAPLNVDASGAYLGDLLVWTGMPFGGTPLSTGSETCGDWLDGTSGSFGYFGVTVNTSSHWFAEGPNSCNLSYRLYCLEQPPAPGP